MEGARNRGVGFIMGDGDFLKSLYILGRGVLTPLFYEDPPYCLLPSFSNFVQPTPPPTSLSPSNASPTVPFVDLFLWLNGWSCHIWCVILLNDNMDIHMSSLGTLVVVAAPPLILAGGDLKMSDQNNWGRTWAKNKICGGAKF